LADAVVVGKTAADGKTGAAPRRWKFSRITLDGFTLPSSRRLDQACTRASHRACTFGKLLCLAMAMHSSRRRRCSSGRMVNELRSARPKRYISIGIGPTYEGCATPYRHTRSSGNYSDVLGDTFTAVALNPLAGPNHFLHPGRTKKNDITLSNGIFL
jgi:hypothetical protein